MNIPGITRALELDDADWDLAVKLRGLTDHQREQFSVALGPAKPSKKSSKKSAGGGKSARGESIKGQLSNRRQERQVINDGGVGANLQPLPDVYTTSGDDLCQFKFPNAIRCSEPQDRNIHHLQTTLGYHPFVSTAQAVGSSSNQVTSEIGKGAASSAHQGGG